jgi:prephenate dehydratase
MRIAIQGVEGSFHHEAAQKWYGTNDITIVPAETFAEIFTLLANNEADEAVIAVENTTFGVIEESQDLVDSHSYPIVGDIRLRIAQQLIGIEGTPLSAIHEVYSHPVALPQCSLFLSKFLPQAKRITYFDTAASVELVKQKGDPTIAAIASAQAAILYGLPILAKDIENNKDNSTRFVVLAK